MIAVRALKFDTEPSYSELSDRFKSMLAKYAAKQNARGVPFDWVKQSQIFWQWFLILIL